MLKTKTILSIILVVGIVIAIAGVSDAFAVKNKLITNLDIGDMVIENYPTKVTVVKYKFVEIDTDVFDDNKFKIKLFNEKFIVTNDDIIEFDDGSTYWHGTIGPDVPVSFMIYSNGIVEFLIHGEYGIYNLHYLYDYKIYVLEKLDMSLMTNPHLPKDIDVPPSLAKLGDEEIPADVEKLANSYMPDHEYDDDVTVTINVAVGFSDKVDKKYNNFKQKITSLISDTNKSYERQDLPIKLVEVKKDDIRGFVETTVTKDFDHLLKDTNSYLKSFKEAAERKDADMTIVVGDYGEFDNCGSAYIFAQDFDNAVAIVNLECLGMYTFTHEIGHIQGAQHNEAVSKNSHFDFGHGYYDDDSRVMKRTVMAYNNPCGNCDRELQWSNPYVDFFFESVPAGTFDKNFNAKVLFATAPTLASLSGATQTYDIVKPTVSELSWWEKVSQVFYVGNDINISASFSENIHDDFPPSAIVTSGGSSITKSMTKVDSKKYTTDHTLENSGTTKIEIKNAKDYFGNEMDSSSDSFNVIVPDITPPVITLTGNTEIALLTSETFVDSGYSCTDTIDGSLSVTVSGDTVVATTLGTYVITYDCEDNSGNDATQLKRTVYVMDEKAVVKLDYNIDENTNDFTATLNYYGVTSDYYNFLQYGHPDKVIVVNHNFLSEERHNFEYIIPIDKSPPVDDETFVIFARIHDGEKNDKNYKMPFNQVLIWYWHYPDSYEMSNGTHVIDGT